MKTLYRAPEITVEELTKRDVLCSSGDTDINPNVFDNSNLDGNRAGTKGLGGMKNVL